MKKQNQKEALLKSIFSSLNESEKYGLLFGLFPIRLKKILEKGNVGAGELIRYAQEQFKKHSN